MTGKSDSDRANARFKKLQRPQDGKSAVSGYEAEQAAVRAKTERLRALRLAHEAANPPPAKPVRAASANKTAAARKKAKSNATLASWLDEQKNSGRNS